MSRTFLDSFLYNPSGSLFHEEVTWKSDCYLQRRGFSVSGFVKVETMRCALILIYLVLLAIFSIGKLCNKYWNFFTQCIVMLLSMDIDGFLL